MTHLPLTVMFVMLAACGGAVATLLPVPLPWMTGSLCVVALCVALAGGRVPEAYVFPQALRRTGTAAIGVAIGAQVSPALVAALPDLALSVAALVPFVILAQAGNYLIFRHIGKYEPVLAHYAGAPGGLVEAITLGQEAGAEMRRLTAQQFLRLIIVLVAVPAGLSLWLGAPVGSASGIGFGPAAPFSLPVLALIVALAVGGLILGHLLRLPAGQITGPLILTGAASLTIAPDLAMPPVLLNAAQVLVGASLGLHFLGITARMMRQAFGLAVLSCGFMLCLTAGFALILSPVSPLETLALIAAFAPGGVTEMSLVALSIGSAPAAVTLHHLVRITLTVWLMRPLARLFGVTRQHGP